MKRLLVATAALSTLLAAPLTALAQEQEHHHDGGRWSGGQTPAPPQNRPAPQPAPAPPAPPQFRAPPAPMAAPQGGYRPDGRGDVRAQGHDWRTQPQFQGQSQGQYQGQYQAQPRPGPDAYRNDGRGQPGGAPGYRPDPGRTPQGYRPGTELNRGEGDRRDGYRGDAYRSWDRDHRDDRGGYRGGPRPGAAPFAYQGRTYYRYRVEPYRFPYQYRSWDHHYWRRGEYLPRVFFLPNYFIGDWWAYGLWEPDYGYQWIRVGADAVLVDMATGEVVDVVPGVYYW